jgi:glycosyltransferase involved in cell wall biosynthesis
MKRVAIDASSLLTSRPSGGTNGIARATREFIGALAQADLPFEVLLFGQRLRGPHLSRIGFPFPVRQIRFPRFAWTERLKTVLPIVEIVGRCDLFHATGNFAYLRRPERAILTLYDAMFLSHPESFLGHDVEARRIPPFARRCRAIITCSQASKRDIVEFMQIPSERIHVLPLGVRHDVFRPCRDSDRLREALRRRFKIQRRYFLQVSCDVGRKNSPLVFDSYRELLKHCPQNDLVMVWRKPPREILELHEQEQLDNRIHFIREVTDSDLRLLYCGATATLFPSAYEGFGLPVLESMACGTPVVTTRLSSLPEVGGDAAVYIELGDSQSVLKSMINFEEGDYNCSNLGEKSILQAARFTWPEYVRRIIPIYQQCL